MNSLIGHVVAHRLLKHLGRLQSGSLVMTLPDGRQHRIDGKQPGSDAAIVIKSWHVLLNLAAKGDVGLAEDYRDGHWESDDLQALVTLALQNERIMAPYSSGSRLMKIIGNLCYGLRANSLPGSRRNVRAHYDLGNDFYRLWLDPTMTYSSAIFTNETQTLEQAQLGKYDRIIDRIAASGSVLEVGCGWGGFAERALDRGDYALKGITLSDEQYRYAANRVGQKSTVALEDYRMQDGQFDNIVSIEMFEAVGEKYWQTYFGKLGRLLKKGGRAVIQTITVEDSHFEAYRTGTDFIRSFIFPGGMLPGADRFAREAAKAGLSVTGRFDFGQDYATTLQHWLKSFDKNAPAVRALGYDDGFIRLWRFYLAACIAGFRTGRTGVMQVELQHA